MIRSANSRLAVAACGLAVLACACALALLVPAPGRASSGGGGMGPGSSGAGLQAGPVAQPANVNVSASASGVTIATQASALLRNGLRLSGSFPSSDAGDAVEIERAGPRTGGGWEPTAQASVASDGTFSAVWRTNHIGRFAIRAVLEQASGANAGASGDWPSVTVTVYLPAVATLYGPGFWGRMTACGVVLRRGTVGVANRRLPCGTPVAVYYGGRTLVVPVIDRGPYANGANWDLTMAAGRALGLTMTGSVGAVSLPRQG